MATPRIYVACLASYNAGRHHGVWLDADDESDMEEGIKAMLAKSPIPGAEEWEIHDTEDFEGYKVGGHDLEKIAIVASFIEEHGEAGARFLEDEDVAANLAKASELWNLSHKGPFKNKRDFAWDELESLDELPAENLRPFFDFKGYGEHILSEGDFLVVKARDGLHVFDRSAWE